MLLIAAVPRRPRQDKSKTDKTAKRGRDFDLVRGSDSLEKPSRSQRSYVVDRETVYGMVGWKETTQKNNLRRLHHLSVSCAVLSIQSSPPVLY